MSLQQLIKDMYILNERTAIANILNKSINKKLTHMTEEQFSSPFTYTPAIGARSSRSDLTRSAAPGHAVRINSDRRRRSVIHCHRGP
ncbi:hypothetical protein PUN28_017117 [Cardiocondyla obscurior]|uniref:Uncharacterized protein n=1 Tax=Cardiocondyla obscurior TaxID=286306 RepID=A0AAW2EP47_9HYME